jgi:DNA modification methylase
MISFDIIQGDSLQVLRSLQASSFDVCLTSPPYYALRYYAGLGDGQLGMEPNHLDYIDKLASIFSEVYRVLKPTGTLWVVIGDTQNGEKTGNTNSSKKHGSTVGAQKKGFGESNSRIRKRLQLGVPPGSLLKIPAKLALEVERRDGWVHRDTAIWVKSNAFSESVANRLGRAYEQILFFSKIPTEYYFARPEEPAKTSKKARASITPYAFGGRKDRAAGYGSGTYSGKAWGKSPEERANKDTRLMRNVLTISTNTGRDRGKTDGHFAPYPSKLCEILLKASCQPGGAVLDPFCGSGTTGVAAGKLNCCSRFVGVDMSLAYCELARNRLVGAVASDGRRMRMMKAPRR